MCCSECLLQSTWYTCILDFKLLYIESNFLLQMFSKTLCDSENQVNIDDSSKTYKIIYKICNILLIILPVICIVMGSMYLLQCPAGNYFSMVLLVAGLFNKFK